MSIEVERPAGAFVAGSHDGHQVTGIARGQRSITVRGRVIPVVGPKLRDPRLHLALVIVSVITIGTALLDFRLSIPHIVITVVVCALVEATYRLITTGALMWPASGMQTATSTVLVLRVVGVEHGDWWTFEGLHWFVGVAVFGLLTKYFVRTSGGHVFNPSNVALVLAFLVLGADRVEPLDYWWGELDWRLGLAYAVIVAGGIVICGRLGLLQMALAFWITLALGVGVLAMLGHSITTRWSFAPVEGWHLWRTIVLSPETMIFLFFMITDPKTTPSGRAARVAFGASVGVVSTLLLAPWPTEFGSKVGLLSGLAVMSVGRLAFERFLPSPGSERDRALPRRLGATAIAAGVAGVVVFGAAAAAAGTPNRSVDAVAVDEAAIAAAAESVTVEAVEQPLPAIVIDPDVAGLSQDLATPSGAEALVRALLFNLEVEAEAFTTGDADLLTAVDHGQRLLDITREIESVGNGERVISRYALDTIRLGVVFPGGFQSGPNAGLTITGTVTATTIGADGAELARATRPLETTFTLRRTSNGTWLTTGTLPPG
jgi:enediyne biosynthesis protein E5